MINLNLDMIIDKGKAVGNRQKYFHLLEFQPQSHAVFSLNLHRFQAEQAASQFKLPSMVHILTTLLFKVKKVCRVMLYSQTRIRFPLHN